MTLAVTSACLRRLMVVSSLAADSVALSQAERIAMSVAACAPEALSSARGKYFVVQTGEREPRADGGGTRQIQNAIRVRGLMRLRVRQDLPVGRLLREHVAVALVNEPHAVHRARGIELFQMLAERVRLFVIRHIGENELLIGERMLAKICASPCGCTK